MSRAGDFLTAKSESLSDQLGSGRVRNHDAESEIAKHLAGANHLKAGDKLNSHGREITVHSVGPNHVECKDHSGEVTRRTKPTPDTHWTDRDRMGESMGMQCANCGSASAACPECGASFEHGSASHCNGDSCRAMNAPLDCEGCGMVVDRDRRGTLDQNMNLIPYYAFTKKHHEDKKEDPKTKGKKKMNDVAEEDCGPEDGGAMENSGTSEAYAVSNMEALMHMIDTDNLLDEEILDEFSIGKAIKGAVKKVKDYVGGDTAADKARRNLTADIHARKEHEKSDAAAKDEPSHMKSGYEIHGKESRAERAARRSRQASVAKTLPKGKAPHKKPAPPKQDKKQPKMAKEVKSSRHVEISDWAKGVKKHKIPKGWDVGHPNRASNGVKHRDESFIGEAQDPTQDEMMKHLKDNFHGNLYGDWHRDGLKDDATVATKYFGDHFHSGQGSNLYAAASNSDYSPGPNTRFEDDMDSGAVGDMYHSLWDKYAPDIPKEKNEAMDDAGDFDDYNTYDPNDDNDSEDNPGGEFDGDNDADDTDWDDSDIAGLDPLDALDSFLDDGDDNEEPANNTTDAFGEAKVLERSNHGDPFINPEMKGKKSGAWSVHMDGGSVGHHVYADRESEAVDRVADAAEKEDPHHGWFMDDDEADAAEDAGHDIERVGSHHRALAKPFGWVDHLKNEASLDDAMTDFYNKLLAEVDEECDFADVEVVEKMMTSSPTRKPKMEAPINKAFSNHVLRSTGMSPDAHHDDVLNVMSYEGINHPSVANHLGDLPDKEFDRVVDAHKQHLMNNSNSYSNHQRALKNIAASLHHKAREAGY